MRGRIIIGGMAAAAVGLAVLLGLGTQPDSGMKIATVDILGLAERYLEKPELSKRRTDLVTNWQDRLKGQEAELKALQDQGQVLTASDPKLRELSAQFEQKRQALGQAQQQAQAEVDQLAAEHLAEAYAALRTAVDTVSAERGYTLVLATRPSGAAVEPKGQNYVVQEMLARPVLRSPAADDLTADIVAALSLPEVPAAPAMDPAGP